MASLEDLIAAQTASANAQKAVVDQTQKENLAALTTEQADVSPAYDKLISDTNAAYQTNLGNARTSASTAGIYRSGIRYNKELALGQSAAQQTGEYGAERTRKLADISRRRTLLASQAKVNADKIQSDLQSTIADLRYKDYQTRQAQEFQANQAALDRAASSSSSSSSSDASTLKAYNSALASGKVGGKPVSTHGEEIMNPTKYSTREELISLLSRSYPSLDPDSIADDVYSTYRG